jgi:hypothetical protein
MDAITAAILGMLVTGVGAGLLSAFAATCAIWFTWMAVRRWGPSRLREPIRRFPWVSVGIPVLVIAFPIGCVSVFLIPRPQPASIRTVAAVEVPLRTPADHADLLAMLRRNAREDGLHVDDGTEQWIQFRRDAPSDEPPDVLNLLTKTISAGVFRGADDNDMEVDVDDGGHQGRAWLTFFGGEHPELATKFRVGLVAEIKHRWPDARDVPVMPTGALPFADDLVWTGASYQVKPERLADYTREADKPQPSRP